jgi:hypothetical protein
MGQDNQSRERQARKLERKKAKRASYDRILIVSEGEKTEPNYFQEIRQHFKLHTANLAILPGEYGTQPTQIVAFARDKFLELNRGFEQVYCVFDRDDHKGFHEALTNASNLDRRLKNDNGQLISFKATPSIPCFELWLLLHFQSFTKEMHRTEVYAELKKAGRLADYEKGEVGAFSKTRHLLNEAYKNADILKKQRERHQNENPYTDIDDLVHTLTNLRT